MRQSDFVVKYDPTTDTEQDLTDRILYAIFVRRAKRKKPTYMFIGADSGEGKSWAALKLMERLLAIQGEDIREYMDDINIYTPFEYPKKIRNLLFAKHLKKINVCTMHEARELIKAKKWQDFLAQSVSDINAQSRSIKRLIFIIISQFIRDITTDVRYTLNYYCKVERRLWEGHSRLYINVMWKDDQDLERPKLRRRKLKGFLVYPNGRKRMFCPQYLVIGRPSDELVDLFEKRDREAKAEVIKRKINKLVKEMEMEEGRDDKKILAMTEHYTKHQDQLPLIGKQLKKGFKLNKEFAAMHDLTKEEEADFKKLLDKKLKDIGMIAPKEDDITYLPEEEES